MLSKEKVILIATPLIEAGVDLSFQKVVRSLTGLDSIAQAAGRCNRNKEKDLGEVILINIDSEIENTSGLEEVKIGQEITSAILNDFKESPARYNNDLLSRKSIELYFENLHKVLSDKTHYNISKDETIYDLLGRNKSRKEMQNYYGIETKKKRFLNQAFFTAGNEFKSIEDTANGVIVPYEDGQEIINKMLSGSTHITEIKELISKIQQYTVGIYSNILEELNSKNALIYVLDYDFYILNDNFYDKDRGLVLDADNLDTMLI